LQLATDALFEFLRSVRRMLVRANVVTSSSILATLMKEALGSSETLVLTRVTRRNVPEDTIIQCFSDFRLKDYREIYLNVHEVYRTLVTVAFSLAPCCSRHKLYSQYIVRYRFKKSSLVLYN
jgi:hypothetical protein